MNNVVEDLTFKISRRGKKFAGPIVSTQAVQCVTCISATPLSVTVASPEFNEKKEEKKRQ